MTGIYQIYKTSGKNKVCAINEVVDSTYSCGLHMHMTRIQRKAGTTGAVAIRNPFLDVVGLSVHVEGAGRSNATFTKEEVRRHNCTGRTVSCLAIHAVPYYSRLRRKNSLKYLVGAISTKICHRVLLQQYMVIATLRRLLHVSCLEVHARYT